MRDHLNGLIESAINPWIAQRLSGRRPSICLLDTPGHANVGDSAILLGELDYLKRNFPAARLKSYDLHSFSEDAARDIEDSDVLLIHGGGNFGDIWPRHHEFRERIWGRFCHKSILQMPQSIHFSSTTALDETAARIGQLSDFMLLARDARSAALARKTFPCETQVVPDMVFAMDAIQRQAPRVDCFGLLRTDKEVRANHTEIVETIRKTGRTFEFDDWVAAPQDLLSRWDSRLTKWTRTRHKFVRPFQEQTLAVRKAFAKQRVAVGVEMLSRGKGVVTDRLHAHLLSTLMSIPHVVFDSYDGKISAFYEAWTRDFQGVRFCSSTDDLEADLIALSA